MSNLGQSGEDYLETILVLGNCVLLISPVR